MRELGLQLLGSCAKADLSEVETINLSCKGVERLAHFELCPKLVSIYLRDNSLTDEILSQAEQAASAQVDPDGDAYASAAYRRKLAGVMTKRAVQQAASRTGGGV